MKKQDRVITLRVDSKFMETVHNIIRIHKSLGKESNMTSLIREGIYLLDAEAKICENKEVANAATALLKLYLSGLEK